MLNAIAAWVDNALHRGLMLSNKTPSTSLEKPLLSFS